MAQTITITVEDSKTMAALRKLLSLMPGVTLSKPKRMTGIERAMEDVKKGRVSRYNSIDELYKELGI